MVGEVILPPDLEVLAHGAGWIGVNKPSGLLSVPGRTVRDSVLTRVRAVEPAAEAPHRLDMDTSGVLIVAVRRQTHRDLCAQFRDRVPRKHYVAVVDGHVAGDDGEISLPIGRDWEDRPRRKVDEVHGKPSTTGFEVLERSVRFGRSVTRVRLHPITGRTHQLRIHMDAIGHPILGDNLYGTEASMAAGARLHLHAEQLEFVDPGSNELMRLTAPVPF